MDPFNELKKEYDRTIKEFSKLIGMDITEEFNRMFWAGVLRIWGSNDMLYSPSYQETLRKITGKTYTREQIMTAMACCSDTERRLEIPEFLVRAVRDDKEQNRQVAVNLIDIICLLWTSAAHINGDYTIEEGDALFQMADELYDYCLDMGISDESEKAYADYKTIPRNDASYIMPDDTSKKPKKKAPPPKSKDSKKEEEDDDGGITVHIRLRPSDDSSDNEGISLASLIGETDDVSPNIVKPEKNESSFEELMEELDGLVGLETVKKDVHSLMNFIRVTKLRQERGMKVPTVSYHLVFTGNPGTGKTTVARLVAQLYYHMGILPEGQMVETDRSALVAGYLGQTAIKTQKVIQKAMGGVLFIDEAYSLVNDEQDSYGKEAIETILKAMEDHRDELVVIVAGYTELMHKFINSNPGLASRFNKYFEFPDYDGTELRKIFERFCSTNGYVITADVADALEKKLAFMFENRTEHFGNARTVRNIFEKAINAQADRIALNADPTDQDLEHLTMEDIEEAMKGI